MLEAMASGLAVVATDVGGVSEVVVPGETGYLVPAASPGALASAIRRASADPGVLARFGHAGRERVEQSFNVRTMAARYEALYFHVLRALDSVRPTSG
jgi:glycosyltransferase involved in cell wall biosynthesis